MLVALALIEILAVTDDVTVIVILLEEAVAGLAHAALEVSSQVITFPFARVVVV